MVFFYALFSFKFKYILNILERVVPQQRVTRVTYALPSSPSISGSVSLIGSKMLINVTLWNVFIMYQQWLAGHLGVENHHYHQRVLGPCGLGGPGTWWPPFSYHISTTP